MSRKIPVLLGIVCMDMYMRIYGRFLVVVLVFIAIPPKIHKNTTFSHRHGISGRNCLKIEVYLWVFACIYFHNSGIFSATRRTLTGTHVLCRDWCCSGLSS
jgi:hypothetical protein